ncbi:hypothetical protein [Thermomonas sp.]|uniref:hypothetical protein n=1 Tax=Thermomonas sp. TaxID=1971895 RepID=UPI00260DC9B2|nr:hypothetical protein [Thermomonas sp.]MCO5054918.1 hypothetical protein [Thermomonas sp.]
MSVRNPATRPFLLASLGTALLAGALFLPGLPGAFLFDDIPNIVNNASIQIHSLSLGNLYTVLSTPQPSGSMRGLPTLSFALDYWRAGGVADPATFKTTNLLIHALTAFALAWLFRNLLAAARVPAQRAAWLAPALALAWAAHPLQVSSVLYAVQRLQTLGTLFLVLALLAYLKARQAQIAGRPARGGFLLTALLWALALNCKEDTVLLPAYTLALELTVLRFAAANARTSQRLKHGYLAATLVGIGTYVFWVIPHYWSSAPYPGRDFNSAERLLTEARVLCRYLWETLLPLPRHMPFYYDWIQPSRGLLHPWTTLPALLLIVGLLALAWRLRHRQPLLALGVFLFFSAHFITSNVIGLELAYEHRNHFALIGAVLAVGSLLAEAARRRHLPTRAQAGLCAALLLILCGATALRAHTWRSAVSLAQAATQAAPASPRAWIDLCVGYLQAGGGAQTRHNPYLDRAIAACEAGADANPETLNSLAVLIALKSLRGDVTPNDWARFQGRLRSARMSWDNARAPFVLSYYAGLGVAMDKAQVRQALDLLLQRTGASPERLIHVGYAVLDELKQPEQALPYFVRAIEASPPGDPLALTLAAELQENGYVAIAEKIRRLASERK